MQLQKIDIDWDIHKMIEGERRSFEELPYIALRRLLKLPALESPEIAPEDPVGAGVPWTEDGVVVPHGSLAKMEYLRGSQVYEGKFLNGMLVVNGQSFRSLSAAANALAVTKDGTKPSLNGWIYWQAKFPGEPKWKSLSNLRDKIRSGR